MAGQDNRDTGIPTRAIHEAYLSMQQAHREYRQLRDTPQRDATSAHAAFQDAVLTFYEFVRPHLKRKSAMQQFWVGELPPYPQRPWQSVDAAKEYCRRYGTAVWSLQEHYQTLQASPNADGQAAVTDGGQIATLQDWHDRLNLTDQQRLVKIDDSEQLIWIELRAVAGLQQLDRWETEERTEHQSGGGFMASETASTTTLEYVAVPKLARAKRLLAEATDKMNLLSRVDIDHDDGAIVNFDQSREGVEAEYRDVEYDSTPDI